MGRGVILNKEKVMKSGPAELIVGGSLQPGYEKYITTSSSASARVRWTNNTSKWATGASAWSNTQGWDTDPNEGVLTCTVRVDFNAACKGKTCTITWNGFEHGRFSNSGTGVFASIPTGWVYYNASNNVNTTQTSTFQITQTTWYFSLTATWDGWTSGWAPSTGVSISYLAIQ